MQYTRALTVDRFWCNFPSQRDRDRALERKASYLVGGVGLLVGCVWWVACDSKWWVYWDGRGAWKGTGGMVWGGGVVGWRAGV